MAISIHDQTQYINFTLLQKMPSQADRLVDV
jgi:hypothetical protein